MSKPLIEYHYAMIYADGYRHQTYELAEAGRTFASVFSWSKLPVTPLRLRWPSHAWPGGYEIHYYVSDGGVLCHQCANEHLDRTLDEDDDQFFVVAQEINYEDSALHCDHCGRDIKPAYGDDDE